MKNSMPNIGQAGEIDICQEMFNFLNLNQEESDNLNRQITNI